MLHEAGMLDAACKSDLIVNGRVNNQSSAASVTAQAHNPDCSALLPVPVPVPTLLTQHKSNTVVLPAVSGLIQLPITGVYQSSSLVSFKACNLSVTQPPHRTEDGLKHSCKLKAAPRTPLSSGESFLWHWVPKAGNITQRKQCVQTSADDLCMSTAPGAILTWTWQQPEGLWRGKGVAPGSAGPSSAARGRRGGTSCCGTWTTAQGDMPRGWWGRSSLPCERKQRG